MENRVMKVIKKLWSKLIAGFLGAFTMATLGIGIAIGAQIILLLAVYLVVAVFLFNLGGLE